MVTVVSLEALWSLWSRLVLISWCFDPLSTDIKTSLWTRSHLFSCFRHETARLFFLQCHHWPCDTYFEIGPSVFTYCLSKARGSLWLCLNQVQNNHSKRQCCSMKCPPALEVCITVILFSLHNDANRCTFFLRHFMCKYPNSTISISP